MHKDFTLENPPSTLAQLNSLKVLCTSLIQGYLRTRQQSTSYNRLPFYFLGNNIPMFQDMVLVSQIQPSSARQPKPTNILKGKK